MVNQYNQLYLSDSSASGSSAESSTGSSIADNRSPQQKANQKASSSDTPSKTRLDPPSSPIALTAGANPSFGGSDSSSESASNLDSISDNSNHSKNRFDSRINTKNSSDPSTISYEQTISPAQKIKESIARAKEGKEYKEIHTLFFDTGRTSNIDNEGVGTSDLVFGAASLEDEDNDNISKARERPGSKSPEIVSKDHSIAKENDEEPIDNPEALFANISKARERAGSKNPKSLAKDKSIAKGINEEPIDDPEAFVANSSKDRDNLGSKSLKSDSVDISNVKRSNESDEVLIGDPEAFFASISKARERNGSKNLKSDSDGNSKVQRSKESDGGLIDDPEIYVANILIARERIGSKKSESDPDDSPKDNSYHGGIEEPKVCNKKHLDDCHELVLAGRSNSISVDNVRKPIIQQDFVSTDQPDEEYKSNISEEERIIFLHDELKKMGISPNIMINRDDATHKSGSGRSSLGEDSYLEDLLLQREDRDDVHREEIMCEALECYNLINEPKSEQVFLEILEEITIQRQADIERKNLIQDNLISKELELRKYRSKRKSFSGNEPKEQLQNDPKKHPQAGRSLFAKAPKIDERNSRPEWEDKKQDKGIKSTKDSLPDQSVRKRLGFEEDNGHALSKSNDKFEGGRNNNAALPRMEPRPVSNQKKKDKGSKSNKDSLPDKSDRKRLSEKEDTGRALPKSNDKIKRGRKSKATVPIPEESSSSSSSSSSADLSQFSINGFQDEYYYDEERAMMDRKAILLLEQEVNVSRQESNLTKKMLLASTLMCCLAFGLLLLLILDPLHRGTLFN